MKKNFTKSTAKKVTPISIEPELAEIARELSRKLPGCPRPVTGSLSWVSRNHIIDFIKSSDEYKKDPKLREKIDSYEQKDNSNNPC